MEAKIRFDFSQVMGWRLIHGVFHALKFTNLTGDTRPDKKGPKGSKPSFEVFSFSNLNMLNCYNSRIEIATLKIPQHASIQFPANPLKKFPSSQMRSRRMAIIGPEIDKQLCKRYSNPSSNFLE